MFGIAGVIEIVTGALVTVGLFTRYAALIASGEMAVAYLIYANRLARALTPLANGGNLEVLYCFSFLLLVFLGAGNLEPRRQAARQNLSVIHDDVMPGLDPGIRSCSARSLFRARPPCLGSLVMRFPQLRRALREFAMPRIAVVGSGLIGRSWAVVFSRAGCDVALYDPLDGVAAKAHDIVGGDLEELAGAGRGQGCRRGFRAHPRRVVAEGCGRRRRSGAGKRAGKTRRQDRAVRRARCRGGAGHDPRLLHLRHRRLALHREAEGPRALSRRPSRQSAASRAGGRDRAGAPWTAPEIVARRARHLSPASARCRCR